MGQLAAAAGDSTPLRSQERAQTRWRLRTERGRTGAYRKPAKETNDKGQHSISGSGAAAGSTQNLPENLLIA